MNFSPLINDSKVPENHQHYLEEIIPSHDDDLHELLKPADMLWYTRVQNIKKMRSTFYEANHKKHREQLTDEDFFEFAQKYWASEHGEGDSSDSDTEYLQLDRKRPRGRPRKDKEESD